MKKLLLVLIFFSLVKGPPFYLWNQRGGYGVKDRSTEQLKADKDKLYQDHQKLLILETFSPDIFHEISYPSQALNHCINGLVTVSFDVHENGEAGEVKITKGLGYGIDEEVLRAFNLCRKIMAPEARGLVVKQEQVFVNFTINGASFQEGSAIIIDSQTFRNCPVL